jgi:TetR/AcrR family transcriptional regulator
MSSRVSIASASRAKAASTESPPRRRQANVTQPRILDAAIREFVDKGFDAARMDDIALRSSVNKNMLYHYFGSKEQLFIAVLEHVYETLRTRQGDMSIRGMDPVSGMRRLVESTGKVWVESPDYLRVLSSENLHEARHVRKSDKIIQMYNPLLDTISELLRRGAEAGVFRKGVDPLDLYISISALTAHYIANRHTFEAIFRTDLMTPRRLRQRLRHASDMILSYLRPDHT